MITATLKNWYFVDGVIFGDIYEDTKGRFKDGAHVRTSRILAITDNVAQTLNSVYKLENKPQ